MNLLNFALIDASEMVVLIEYVSMMIVRKLLGYMRTVRKHWKTSTKFGIDEKLVCQVTNDTKITDDRTSTSIDEII